MIASQELEYPVHNERRVGLSRVNPCSEDDSFFLFMMIEVLIHHGTHLHALPSENIAARSPSLPGNTWELPL
jgi:hypothetical protein